MTLLSVSGKMGAGKDTVAPLVLDGLSIRNAAHMFFAQPLKKELNDLIEIIRDNDSDDEASAVIAEVMSVPGQLADQVVSRIGPEVREDLSETSYSRTKEMRFALQFWGTEVRRAQDDSYWVRKAVRSILDVLADGRSVYVTDARFTNEIDALREILAITVRLDVSSQVQARRILTRDGVRISESARLHPSETTLDDYDGFDIRLNTDTVGVDETVKMILERIRNGQA